VKVIQGQNLFGFLADPVFRYRGVELPIQNPNFQKRSYTNKGRSLFEHAVLRPMKNSTKIDVLGVSKCHGFDFGTPRGTSLCETTSFGVLNG